MSRTVITPTRPVALQALSNRRLAAVLAALIVAGGAALASSGDDSLAPAKPNVSPTAPIIFGDPPVLKGARGGETDVTKLPVFRDPTIRKGAGGR